MLDSNLISKLNIRIIEDPEEILRYLYLGIKIPIVPELNKFILADIQSFKAKAILLEKEINENAFDGNADKVVGLVLVYDDQGDTLFFGYFGVYDHDVYKIEFLVDQLINYAKHNKYKCIRGPINIPTAIYGWGFMVDESSKDLFIGCPINPPAYQEVFLKKGFFIKFEIERYYSVLLKLNPHKLPNYDFTEYEFVNPGKEGIWDVLDEFLRLHIEFQPPSAQITPKKSLNLKYLVDFIYSYGEKWMVWCVYHKLTNRMVACGYVIPNIFHTNKHGKLDSFSFHDWVVDPNHRRKGLAMLMYGETSLRAFNRKNKNFYRWGYWPVGAENIASKKAAEKMGGIKKKIHIILEFNF